MTNVKVGFSYRSRADIRFDSADAKLGGAFSPTTTKATVRPLPLPPVINAGVFWQITPSWSAELVYEHTRWKEFNRFAATFSPTPLFLGFVPISSFTLPQDWKNTSAVRVGGSHQFNTQLQIRAGLGIEEGPIPNKTLNPSIPGADALSLNLGIGYSFDRFTLDFGYVAAFYKDRKVINSELEGTPATGIPFSGAPGKDKHKTFNNLLSLGASYRF
jgi:long-chain fatty acid transport protein